MADPPDKDRLRTLEDRIARARKGQEPAPHADTHYSQAHLAWRMVIELVAGLAVGFAMGYGLDLVFGTLPVFLLVFVMLGFAAGVKTMLRTAREVETGQRDDAPSPKDERD